jgi:hypothetical protein
LNEKKTKKINNNKTYYRVIVWDMGYDAKKIWKNNII